MVSAGDQN